MILIYIIVVIISFILMEGVTWLTHKYVMHGFLWVLHEDHHDLANVTTFEKNDGFFFIFASPSILLFYFGALPSLNFMFFIGLGIMFYGVAYFLVHDVFIHGRLNWLQNTKSTYLRGLLLAHKNHHKGGKCFGMLYVPRRFMKEAKSGVNSKSKTSLI